MEKKRILVIMSALVIMIAVLSSCGVMNYSYQQEVVKCYDSSDTHRVILNNISGDIEVKRSADTQIKIVALKRGFAQADVDNIEIKIEHKPGASVRIDTIYNYSFTNGSVDYTVIVPYDVDLDLSSTSGDIIISGGNIVYDVETTSGNITIENVHGVIDVETTSGDIDVTVERLVKNLNVTATSGDISITIPDGIYDELHTETVSGDVNREISSTGDGRYDVNVDVVSGDINFYGK